MRGCVDGWMMDGGNLSRCICRCSLQREVGVESGCSCCHHHNVIKVHQPFCKKHGCCHAKSEAEEVPVVSREIKAHAPG